MEFLTETNPSGLVVEAKAEFIAKSTTKKSKAKPRKKTKNQTPPNTPNQSPTKTSGSSVHTPTPNPVETTALPVEPLPWELEKTPDRINWNLVAMVGMVILLGQLIYHKAGSLSQNVSYRPYLEKLCHGLGCQLADYKNLNDFEVLRGSFTPNANNTITFKAVISNQAQFKQPLPNIKLTLLDFQEQVFSQRVFTSSDYMPKRTAKTNAINPDESMEVQLQLRTPKTPIGGYAFDLVY